MSLHAERKHPQDADIYAGQRLRTIRIARGMSQETVGDALGLTFQQVQKYEKGTNRMGSSRLQQLARLFKVEPSYFFRPMDSNGHDADLAALDGFASNKQGQTIIKAFTGMTDAARESLVEVAQLFARMSKRK